MTQSLHRSAEVYITIPSETTPLMGAGTHPQPMMQSVTVSGGKSWLSVARTVAVIYTLVMVNSTFSTIPPTAEVLSPLQNLSWNTTFVKPPENLYDLPLNESCREEYLDRSSNNLCWVEEDVCLKTFNCPRKAMPQFNRHATVMGFLAWHGHGTYAYIPAKEVFICQRELFYTKVKYDMSKKRYPIPGKPLAFGKQGRVYPLSSEKCVLDGNHEVEAAKKEEQHIKVIQFTTAFFPLITAAKEYLKLCWTRVLSTKICHLSNESLMAESLYFDGLKGSD